MTERLAAAVAALPIEPGMRILEIGCGPGVAARLIVARHPGVFVLGLDRSAKAIALAETGCAAEVANGQIKLRQGAIDDFTLAKGEEPFDLAFAIRVGALDGRHPAQGVKALQRIDAALTNAGMLYIDGKLARLPRTQ